MPPIPRRLFSLISAVLLLGGTLTAAEAQETGIALSVAEWLEPWDPATGGWIAVATGAPIKAETLMASDSMPLAPGDYDIYWVQNDETEPFIIAESATVLDGQITDLRIVSGARLEIADWVPGRDPVHGWFGAILPQSTEFDLINWTRNGSSIVLPPGEYDFFYETDETDNVPPIWLGNYAISAVYGGLGIEVALDEGVIVVVRPLPEGPAEEAGIIPGDAVIAVDGVVLGDLAMIDAVSLLRGAPGSEAVLTIERSKRQREITLIRQRVEPRRIVFAAGGIRLLSPDGREPIQPGGWWGVVFAGDDPVDFVNWMEGRSDTPMLLGPANYDVYWSPDGVGDPELLANSISVPNELVEVEIVTGK